MALPYFAYGSNMNLEQMAVRCPGARMVDLVRKTGWRYLINQRGYVTSIDDPDKVSSRPSGVTFAGASMA